MSGLVCGLRKSGEWERRSIVVATIVKMKTKGEEEVPREGVVANWRDAQRYGTAACLAQKGTRYELKLVTILAVECRLRKATHMVPSAFARREGRPRSLRSGYWGHGTRGVQALAGLRPARFGTANCQILPPPWARVRLKLAPNGISIVFMDVALLHSCV